MNSIYANRLKQIINASFAAGLGGSPSLGPAMENVHWATGVPGGVRFKTRTVRIKPIENVSKKIVFLYTALNVINTRRTAVTQNRSPFFFYTYIIGRLLYYNNTEPV